MSLYLLPNVLDEEQSNDFFPPAMIPVVEQLDGLIAESEKSGRHFLRRFVSHDRLAATPLRMLNEHTPPSELGGLLDPMMRGERWGLVSDAGLPCLADPGAPLVLLARQRGLSIVAFPGPSAPILALQLSGLNGQQFAFHGYLPREQDLLAQKLVQLQSRSRDEGSTQIWIEAPYRSAKMAHMAVHTLQPSTLLCLALNITTPKQSIQTLSVAQWRQQTLKIEKERAVFLLSDQAAHRSN